MSDKRQWYDHPGVSKEEREKIEKRVQWMITQERLRQHEKQKRKVIEEFERNRAKKLGLEKKRRSSERRSRSESRSRSRSKDSHHRSRFKNNSTGRNSSNTGVMSEKLNSMEDNKPFFKGPEDAPKIDPEELRVITVKIHRNIPSASETNEIRRDIVNHEDITVKRRDGEGIKPIFDREELKQADAKPVEVEEHRVVEAIGKSSSAKKNYMKRRSASLSPRRRRSPSPHVHPSSRTPHTHRSRSDVHIRSRHDDQHRDHKSDRRHSRSRDNSREDRRRRLSPRPSRARSHSRDRDRHRSDRDYSRSSRSEKDYRDKDYRDRREYRERSSERSHDRRERRDSSRERHHPPVPYADPVPYPVYYGPFPPRPMMLGPPVMPPIRGPMGRGRGPVAPIRPPFPPRFVGPQDMYRPDVLPPDPRFGRMY